MKKQNQNNSKVIALTFSFSFIFTLYILATILVTLVFSHQQIIVGTIVNSLLFFTALNIEKKYHLPVAIFPSIVAVSQGLLFGKFTVFLLYFLPFIWLGNFILMITVQKFSNRKILRFIIASFSKATFLFLIANFYVFFKITPKMFLQAMGIFQLITALLGALLYNLINFAITKK